MSWRPKGWSKSPCEDCSRREEDKYGLICDINCGKYTACLNYEAGADAMLKAIRELLEARVKKIYSSGSIEPIGGGEPIRILTAVRIHLSAKDWQAIEEI